MDQKEINIYIRVLIFSILLLIIITGFILSFLKQNKKFHREKLEAEIRGSEAERKKIASELHDELGPVLASIKIYLNSIKANNASESGVLEKINTQLNNCLQLVREMANLLMPNILQRKGLRKALEEFIANIAPVVHFEIHFVFPEFNISFNKEKELNVYRIIQEIVTNTIKHSGCTKLEIIFSKSETAVLINSLDNGFGFHLDDILYATKGCGIANIRNRINLLNGKMQIDTKINEGTRYNISIPLSNI